MSATRAAGVTTRRAIRRAVRAHRLSTAESALLRTVIRMRIADAGAGKAPPAAARLEETIGASL
ncbi:hypothetical protein GCM10009643_19790 [Microbacterium aurantiacum]